MQEQIDALIEKVNALVGDDPMVIARRRVLWDLIGKLQSELH